MATMMAFIRKKYKGLATSLRFEVVDNAFRRYPDEREVCLDNEKGEAEYKRRTMEMHDRQNGICSRGDHRIMAPTFDHSTNGRGAGGATRDDRIWNENHEPINSCSCWLCNGKAGSKRIGQS